MTMGSRSTVPRHFPSPCPGLLPDVLGLTNPCMPRRVVPGPAGCVGTPCTLRARHRRVGTSRRWRMRIARGLDGRSGGMTRLCRRCRRRSDGRRGGECAHVWRNRRSGRGCRLSRRSWISVRELAFWSASGCIFELERAASCSWNLACGYSCGGGGGVWGWDGDGWHATADSMETYYGLYTSS